MIENLIGLFFDLTVLFCLTFGAAGFTEFMSFCLGIEVPGEQASGRIFSFIGRILPFKCAYCINFWLFFAMFGAAFYFQGWPVISFIFLPVAAGVSHSFLKIIKSFY